MKKNIAVLGVSGSIGRSTLRVIREYRDELKLFAVTVNKSIDFLEEVIDEFEPKIVVVSDEEACEKFRKKNKAKIKICAGARGLIEAVCASEVDIVVSALVGFAGLVPTLEAMDAKKDIALANKEVLVVAGEIVKERAKKKGVRLIPIDSEINAIKQLLKNININELKRIIITASGGPLLEWDKSAIEFAGVDEVLNHPTWSMGAKITVDSASLVNKGFEVIETHWLFDVPYEMIDVIVHPNSVIHSMIEMKDGAIFAHLSPNDMVFPIKNALLFSKGNNDSFKGLDLGTVPDLRFLDLDYEKFGSFETIVMAGKKGGCYPAMINRINEINVEKYLNKELNFGGMEKILKKSVEMFSADKCNNKGKKLELESIFKSDKWAVENWNKIKEAVEV